MSGEKCFSLPLAHFAYTIYSQTLHLCIDSRERENFEFFRVTRDLPDQRFRSVQHNAVWNFAHVEEDHRNCSWVRFWYLYSTTLYGRYIYNTQRNKTAMHVRPISCSHLNRRFESGLTFTYNAHSPLRRENRHFPRCKTDILQSYIVSFIQIIFFLYARIFSFLASCIILSIKSLSFFFKFFFHSENLFPFFLFYDSYDWMCISIQLQRAWVTDENIIASLF